MAGAAGAAVVDRGETATDLRAERCEDAQAFLAAAGDYLSAREAEHNLLLGLAGILVTRPLLFGDAPYFAVAARSGEVVGAALRTPPHSVVLSELDEAAAVEPLVRDVGEVYERLPGVLGPKEAARHFAELWARSRNEEARLARAQRIFRADGASAPARVQGAMRRAHAGDRAVLVEWVAAFQAEVGDEAPRPARDVVEDRLGRGEEGGFYLWEDGEPVSLAGYGGPTPTGIRVGPVYTPPELRGNGYASALVAELTNLLLESGRRFCFLFTDLANPTSNRIYERIGYRPVTDVDVYRFS